jgi:subtilisin family serine protease
MIPFRTKTPGWLASWRPVRRNLVLLLAAVAIGVFFHTKGLPQGASDARQARRARLQQGIELTTGPKYVAGEVLVRFRAGTSEQNRLIAHSTVRAQTAVRLDAVDRLERVRLPQDMSVEEGIDQYRRNPDVLYAEPNYIVHADNLPNDPQFPQQWNLHNTGQAGGTPGADIHAPEAWDITTGSSSVVVAVIDTGVDYTHPDLAAQIWSAPAPFTAKRFNGDIVNCPAGSRGFNAVDGICDPQDDNGHGTHVSGILGAVGNNGTGVAGVNWSVQILPCKFLNSSGFGDLSGALACLSLIKSLKDSGINIAVSNNSWGGSGPSQALADAIDAQRQDGILFVAAAGNDFSDNDLVPRYPASFYLPNMISVAASTRRDKFPFFTNIGRHTVHVTAPGDEILSTTPKNTYSVFSGTSMATPHVTGVIALLKAQDPSRDWRALKNLVLAGGDPVVALGETITGRRLNAAGSLSCTNQTVSTRLQPVADTVSGVVGKPLTLAALNIRCAQPAGNVLLTVSPGGQTVTLADDGANGDQAAGDGVYTGQWTPVATGVFTLMFPDGEAVRVSVLNKYTPQVVSSAYVGISGTNLNLGDDSLVQVTSPFPITYGGGSFTQLFISSNGTISFTDAFGDYQNASMPNQQTPPLVVRQPVTLVAPLWQDLFPVKGSSQNVFWDVVGAVPNRQLVVEWRDVRSFLCRSDANATVKFQAVFFEGKSDVQFNYADAAFGGNCMSQDYGAAATVGLQEALDTAQMFSFNSAAIPNGSSVLWTIPAAPPPQNPVPVIGSISPTSALIGGPSFTLTVNGSNFVRGSRIRFWGADRPTTFVSDTQLTTQIDPSTVPFGTPGVSVFTPAPGGGTSAVIPFIFLSPVPVITSITPSTVTAGGLSFSLRVDGRGVGGAINWNGSPLQSFPLSGNLVFAPVPFNLIANPGTVQITVVVRGPGGGTSNSVPLTIAPPQSAVSAAMQQPAPQPVAMDNNGKAYAPPSAPAPRPIRFLGWNYGRTLGPAYFKHFARPHGGTAIPLQNPAEAAAARAPGTRSAASAVSAAATPASLPGFGLRKTLPTDFIPTSVAMADFNRDGKLDWVVSNGGSNTLWLYFGKGDGTAQLPIVIPLKGISPIQVIAADLRKSGITDLVVAEADSGTVGVLLGNGDGTFQPEVTYEFPAPVLCVAAGDFDGDGKVDIVAGIVGDESTGPVALFRGDGTGRFGPPITRPPETGIGPFAVFTLQAFDFNGDGLPDLVLTDEGFNPGVHVYLSQGDGTFKHSQFLLEDGPFSQSLNAVAGKLNELGCPDVVVSTTSGAVFVFNGRCDGSFDGFPNVFGIGAGDTGAGLALADVDGDGHLDVITSGIYFDVGIFGPNTGDAIAVLRGDGRGNLSPGKIYRGETGMFGLAVGDLNGDGRPDLVTSNQDTDTASVYLNDSKGGYGDPRGAYIGYVTDGRGAGPINAPFCCPTVIDVDGDGKPDLAVILFEQFTPLPWKICVLRNDGTGHFGAPILSDAFEGTFQIYDVRLADVRGTGRPDLLVLGSDLNSAVTYLGFAPNIGGGSFGPVRITKYNQSPGIFTVGDFNGDGKLDVVIGRGSGRSDLIDRISVLIGNGDGTFQAGTDLDFGPAATTGGPPRRMLAGDFNKDGKLDLIVSVNDNVIGAGSLPHPAYEFFGRGDGTFQPPTVILQEAGALSLADVNKDGQLDIIEQVSPITIQGFQPPQFKIHLGRPDGSFQDGATYSPFAGLSSGSFGIQSSPRQSAGPLLGDFNGDGNIDIAVPQLRSGINEFTFSRPPSYMQFLLGNGDGTFTPDYAIHDFGKGPLPTVAADLNGDGRADLIEVDPWPSSFNVILSAAGAGIQARLVADPVIGTKGTLRVNLSLISAAPTTVQLSASDPAISIPASVTIPAGTLSQDVPFTIGAGFNPAQVFALQATLGTDVAVAYGTQARPGQRVGFRLFAGGSQSTPPGGTTADYGVSALSINGYATSVRLSCQGLPAGASCQFGTTSLDVPPGTFTSTTLNVQVASTVPFGSYPFTVLATDGAISDQGSATLNVSDFSLTLTPSSQNALAGGFARYTLTMNSFFNWTQAVQLTCSVPPAGPSCPLTGISIVPGSQDLTLNLQSVAAGNYTVNVSGTGLGVTRSASAQLHVQDFSGTFSNSAATISVGGSANLNVTLNSVNGFTDTFSFQCLNAPAAISCTFNPATGSLQANGNLISVLTVKVNSRPSAGMASDAGASPGRIVHAFPGIPNFALCLCVLMLTLVNRHSRPKWQVLSPGICLLFILVLSAAGIVACGGGGSSSPPPPPPPPTTVVIGVQATSASLTKNLGNITITIP